MQRHITEQQVQDSTQEEENPPCNSEGEEESLSFDEKDDETDYVLAEIGSRVEDDKEENNIQMTMTTRGSGRRATRYLFKVNYT